MNVNYSSSAPPWLKISLEELSSKCKTLKGQPLSRFWIDRLEYCNALLTELPKSKYNLNDGIPPEPIQTPAYINFPPSYELEAERTFSPKKIQKPSFCIVFSLRASDTDLIEAFKEHLRNKRKEHPSALTRRGPKLLNAEFNSTLANSWLNHRIVQIAQLIHWREHLHLEVGLPRPKDSDFARWLFPEYSEPSKAFRDGKKALNSAVQQIGAVWAHNVRKSQESESAKQSEKKVKTEN